ncbi:MAG TPA: tRNA lysidine(34) synthetase TilS, partial [Thermoanaerobaculia bacterium]|nr:tRNA lysidine(34) synthetase TilS [Thermoanaerobaculia bacterium]
DGALDGDEVKRIGVEAAAREVRLRAFAAAREKAGSAWVATAHQKNDQAETVLMRLLSGGGLGSLQGIRPVREWMIRPLLDIGRDEIETFLQQRAVAPRRDRMNDEDRYLRVRTRRMLRDAGPESVDHLASIARQMHAMWPIVEKAIDDADSECTEPETDSTLFVRWPNQAYLCTALLLRHIRRLDPHSRDISAEDLARIVRGIEKLKRQSLTSDLELLRTDRGALLRRRPVVHPPFELSLRAGEGAEIAAVGVRIRVVPAKRGSSARSDDMGSQLFQLPHGAEPAFVVRNRRDGDRFQPLGLERAKKLKDFLIDRKIPAERRNRIPLLIWNDQIVCLVGVEVSEGFKVTDRPGDVYEVRLETSAHSLVW